MNDKMVRDEVMETITSGKVKMRPRWYFILRDMLGIIAIIIVLLIAVYLASCIIFLLRQSNTWFVSIFGLAGWYALFTSLPLVLLILAAIFVVTLAVLSRRYPFGYQWPFLYSILAVIFLVAGVCFVFIQSSLYSELFGISPIPSATPFVGTYYPGLGILQADQVHRGEFVSLTPDGFIINDSDNNISLVQVASSTKLPAGKLIPGEMLVIFGNTSPTGTIFAVGAQQLTQ